MPGRIDVKLAELGIALPSPMPPIANYVPYVVTGNLVVVSGQVPAVDGKIAITGKVGAGVSIDRGQGGGAALLHQRAGPFEGGVRRRPRQGRAGGSAGRIRRVAAGVHPAGAGDERRLGPGGGGVRRSGSPCPNHDRSAGAAGRCGGRSRGHV